MPLIEPPRIELAQLPTPLLRLDRLSREWGGEIWLKRDDLTGLELSGNKVRKLEYVLADALAAGCDTIVTEGTCQSNHCRATAAACARLGLRCVLLLRPRSRAALHGGGSPQPPSDGGPLSPSSDSPMPQGNHLLDLLLGAQMREFDRPHFDDNREAIVADVLKELRSAGRRPRWVPMGASEPLGCWGYIRAAAELGPQLAALHLPPGDVVVAISSGGTYAGLLLGKLLGYLGEWRLLAVPVSDSPDYFRRETGGLCRAAVERFRLPVSVDESAMEFIDGYVGPGYAVPYAAAMETMRLAARCEGIVLDPVYTGKAFCAVVEGVRAGRLGRGRPVMFIHTGGSFSNFAWPELLISGAGR